MVNLYSSPAQAKFINTYVPIQFEQLYKMADKAEKDLEQSDKFMEELITDSNLNTPSKIDVANWEKKVKTPIMQLAEQAASDPDIMKSKAFQAQIKATSRRIKSDTNVHTMVNNAAAMKQFMAKSDARWQGIENEDVFNYDSTKDGMFSLQNKEYVSGGGLFKESTDKIQPTLRFTDDGNWMIKEVNADQINGAIESGAREAMINPAAAMHWKLALKNGTAENYKKINADGTTSYDPEAYIKDLGRSANKDAIHIESVQMTPGYELKMKEQSQMRIHRAAKALERSDNPSAAKIFMVDVADKMGKVNNDRYEYSREVLANNLVKYSDGTFKPRKSLSGLLSDDEKKVFNASLNIANNKSKSATERSEAENTMKGLIMSSFDKKMSEGARTEGYSFSASNWNRINSIPLLGQNHDEALKTQFGSDKMSVKIDGVNTDVRKLTKSNQPVVYNPTTGSTAIPGASTKIQNIMNSDEFGGSMMFEALNSYTIQSNGVIPNGYALIPIDQFKRRSKDIFGSQLSSADAVKSAVSQIGGSVVGKEEKQSGADVILNIGGNSDGLYVKIPIKTRAIGAEDPAGATISTNAQAAGGAWYVKEQQQLK